MLQGEFRRQYLDIGKRFNAADRPSPSDRALRGLVQRFPNPNLPKPHRFKHAWPFINSMI
jgi:hypothetical protein